MGFPQVGPCSADYTGWHQKCPLNELPVGPCDFVCTPLGLYVQCANFIFSYMHGILKTMIWFVELPSFIFLQHKPAS